MTGPRVTVLLVEDDDLLRGSFAILLEESGYRVLQAGTAADALNAAREHRPGLVILDLGLPDRPGLDVVREIRSDAEIGDTPVVALTGRVGAGEEEACLEAGCDRYLPKPVAPNALLTVLSGLVEA